MGCTIYAASPKALPADEAPGQDRYYPVPHYRHPHGNCSQRIAASRARSVNSTQELFLGWLHIQERIQSMHTLQKEKKITVLNSSRKSVFNLSVFASALKHEWQRRSRDEGITINVSAVQVITCLSQLVITDTTKCVTQGLFVRHCQLKTTQLGSSVWTAISKVKLLSATSSLESVSVWP